MGPKGKDHKVSDNYDRKITFTTDPDTLALIDQCKAERLTLMSKTEKVLVAAVK